MELGFADKIGVKDGDRYAVIWMTVDTVEDALACHASIRILPLVIFDRNDFIEYGYQDNKKARWYRVEKEVEL